MKKIDVINSLILVVALSGLIYYGYQFYRLPLKVEDPREKEYLTMELKRNQVIHAIRYVKEKQFEEALMILEQSGIDENPYAIYLKGYVFFKIGKKQEGLTLIKEALQRSSVLYDLHYPNNVRAELEELLTELAKDEKLKEQRHFIESKLKGGCG
ncbi:MAG: hypothetical protein OHK0040_04310 [bacterium]